MAHPLLPGPDPDDLFRRLAGLRRAARRDAWLRGCCRVAAVVLAGVAVAALLDRLLDLPAAARAIALAGLLAAAAVVAWRDLLRPLAAPDDDLALALRVERHFPLLADTLASAVQFLRAGPDAAGSAELRGRVVQMAVRRAAGYDFAAVHDPAPARKAAGLLGGVAALAVALAAAAAPGTIPAALARLADPFGPRRWPPRTTLVVTAPEWPADGSPLRVPRGEPFALHAAVGGVLPARATVRLALDGAAVAESVVPVTPDGGLAVRLEPARVPRPFRVRVTAGDADTGWLAVDVRPPPALVPLGGRPSPQLRLTPPAYTGLAAADAPDGTGAVEVPAGTVVGLRAAADRPLARASLAFAPDQPAVPAALAAAGLLADPLPAAASAALAAGLLAPVPAELADEGRTLGLAFEPRLSGTYALTLTDADGMAGARLLDVRVLADPAPQVRLDRPSPARDGTGVLPGGVLPLDARADDPLYGVRSVWLEYRHGRDGEALRLPLTASVPDGLAAALAAPAGWPAALAPIVRPATVAVRRPLAVADLRRPDGSPPREGDVIVLRAAADDYDDVSPGKGPGRSAEVEIQVVGAAELEARVQKEVGEVRQDLLRALKQQQQAAAQAAEVAAGRPKGGAVRPDDAGKLAQAEQAQEQVRSRVGGPEAGLAGKVARLREAVRDNDLPRTGTADRLDEIAAELDRLAREELPPVEPLLARARKDAGQPPARGDDPLARAQKHQREVERTLAGLLGRLEPWSGAAEARGEARELLRDQRAAAGLTEKLKDRVPAGATAASLERAVRDELDKAAQGQERLAARAGQLFEKLGRLAVEKKEQADARQREADEGRQAAAALGEDRVARAKQSAARDRQDEADRLKREADALANAAQAAQAARDPESGQEPFARAAAELKGNETGNAAESQKKAAKALERVIAALEERAADDPDRLAKRLKDARRELADLTDAQERLQRKVEAAGKLADPKERAEELDRLRREQDELRQEARDLVERLSRLRAGDAARAVARAGRQMDRAGERMQSDEPAEETQDEALDRLDEAAAELDKAEQEREDGLLRERLAKMAERVRALKGRQEAAVAEAARLAKAASQPGASIRVFQQSYKGLAKAQKEIADDVTGLAQEKFDKLPVFGRLTTRAAEAMAEAAALFDKAPPEADAPQQLALRRLTQLLDALKPDDRPQARKSGGGRRGERGASAPGESEGGGGGDGVPPEAQLKALRSLQAELAERTAAFAKAHPDRDKVPDAARAELKAIRDAQADVAALVDELAGGKP